MRTLRLGLCGLLCALALLALPLGAGAAPALTLTPATTPAGQPVTLAGTGFPANAAFIFYVKDPTGAVVDDPTARGTITVGADGTFQTTITPSKNAPPGRYDIIVANGTTAPERARVTLTLTSSHGEALTVAPATGPAGTTFAVTGPGFQAGAHLLVAAFTGNAQGPATPPVPVTVRADGQLRATIDSTGLAPGTYQARVAVSEHDPILATAVFTVTAAAAPSPTVRPSTTATAAPAATVTPAPSATVTPVRTPTAPAPIPTLPNTGGGGGHTTPGTPWPLLLLALLALGGVATRQYMAHRRR